MIKNNFEKWKQKSEINFITNGFLLFYPKVKITPFFNKSIKF